MCLLRHKLHPCPSQVDHQYTNFLSLRPTPTYLITTIPPSLSLPLYRLHFNFHFPSFNLTKLNIPSSSMDPSHSSSSPWTTRLTPPTSRLFPSHRIKSNPPSCTELSSTIQRVQTLQSASATGVCMRTALSCAVARSTSPACSLGVSK